MQEGKKTLIAIVVISSVIASACFGFIARTRAEMGSLATNKPIGVGLLASTDKFGETSESEYFYEVAELLRQKYVEPIKIDQKMASGAVRGMVSSLLDPESNFYDPDQFKEFLARQNGTYSGIGVELSYKYNQDELRKIQTGEEGGDPLLLLPAITIGSIMPGGPAEQAGLKVGDEIRKAQGKYIITGQDVKELRDLQTAVTEGKASVDDLKIMRDDIQNRVDNVLSVSKARDYLLSGTEGEIQLTIKRDGKEMTFDVPRQTTTVKSVIKNLDGTIALRFFQNAIPEIESLTIEDGLTFDLRNSGLGNYNEMERALSKFLPPGTYGGVINNANQVNRRITLIAGPEKAPNLTLIVDDSTTGAAATFARILASSGNAVLQGTLSDKSQWTEIQTLPDGSGYTLAIGSYSDSVPTVAQATPKAENK